MSKDVEYIFYSSNLICFYNHIEIIKHLKISLNKCHFYSPRKLIGKSNIFRIEESPEYLLLNFNIVRSELLKLILYILNFDLSNAIELQDFMFSFRRFICF